MRCTKLYWKGSRLAETTESPQCLTPQKDSQTCFCRTTDYDQVYIITINHVIRYNIDDITYKYWLLDLYGFIMFFYFAEGLFVCLCDNVDYGHWQSMWAVEEFLSWIDEESKVNLQRRECFTNGRRFQHMLLRVCHFCHNRCPVSLETGLYNSQVDLRDILDITVEICIWDGFQNGQVVSKAWHGMMRQQRGETQCCEFGHPCQLIWFRQAERSKTQPVSWCSLQGQHVGVAPSDCLEILALHAASWSCIHMGIMYFHELYMIHHDTLLCIFADTQRSY